MQSSTVKSFYYSVLYYMYMYVVYISNNSKVREAGGGGGGRVPARDRVNTLSICPHKRQFAPREFL